MIVEELARHALPQCVLLLIACVAGIAALRRRGRWLAGVAVLAPMLALALTMVELANAYTRALELHGLLPSPTPLPPADQRSAALMALLTPAPMRIGYLAAVLLPLTTWIAARTCVPGPQQRTLRALMIGAAAVMAIALAGASYWADQFIFIGSGHHACPRRGWWEADLAFSWLSRLRAAVVIAGVVFGLGVGGFAIAQARRGAVPSPRVWAGLLALFGLALAAKSWTADERRDARGYFRHEPIGHYGFANLRGVVADPFEGPTLDHCSFAWPGADLLRVLEDSERQPEEELAGDVEFLKWCGEDAGLDVILADPAMPIPRFTLMLRTADAEGRTRLGVASLRPEPTSRATTGEFVRLRSCAVEFRLGRDGVPLDSFATWGELAAAVDAAAGELVIAP